MTLGRDSRWILARASLVLDKMVPAVCDAVRIRLTHHYEGGLPAGLTTDTSARVACFRAKAKKADRSRR